MAQKDRGIGPRIAEARRTAGLTQEGLAAAAGFTARAIQSWEIGARHPRRENLQTLALVLDRDVSWFYEVADPDGSKAAA